MNHFGIDENILDFIVDENPLKQGLYTPVSNIPVLPSSEIYNKKPDYVLILAWNFAEPIMKNHAKYLEQGGQFIIPLPKVKTIIKHNVDDWMVKPNQYLVINIVKYERTDIISWQSKTSLSLGL